MVDCRLGRSGRRLRARAVERQRVRRPSPPSPRQENLAAPTYNESGLLCSIGGVPATGCGQQVADGYDYWSYWHGATGTWVYSEVGASARTWPDGRRRRLALRESRPREPKRLHRPPRHLITRRSARRCRSHLPRALPRPRRRPGAVLEHSAEWRRRPPAAPQPWVCPRVRPVTTVTVAASSAHSTRDERRTSDLGHTRNGERRVVHHHRADVDHRGSRPGARCDTGTDGQPGYRRLGSAVGDRRGLVVASLVAAAAWRWRRRPRAS